MKTKNMKVECYNWKINETKMLKSTLNCKLNAK